MHKVFLRISMLIGFLFIFSAAATNNYMFIWDPRGSLIKRTSSYEDSIFSRWQVDYLLKQGVSPGSPNADNTTAYMIALISKQFELLKIYPQYMTKEEKIKALDYVNNWQGHNPKLMTIAKKHLVL